LEDSVGNSKLNKDGYMSLRIYTLGQFKLQANDLTLDLPARSGQSLLAYLALNAGVTTRREKLASLLWPEANETNARGYLRQALWHIRKSLEAGSLHQEDYLQISDISITFDDQSNYWLDANLLLSRIESTPVEEIIEIVRLYRGELLPGFYDEWIVVERERLLMAYHQKMNTLLELLMQARRWDEVLNWSEQWIRLGHAPEPAYRVMMRAYAGFGNLGMVGITYRRCVDALNRELAADPSPETHRLYEQLREGVLEEQLPPSTNTPERINQPPFFFDRKKPHRLEKPLVVAREREFAQLNAFLELALIGKGRVIFVTGEAGSGKTTLVNEFTERARKDHPDLIVASGNCNAYTGIGDPYLPFREILELLTGDVEASWSAGAITREYAQFLWNLIPASVQALMDSGPDLMDTFVPGAVLLERAVACAGGNADWVIRLNKFLKHKMIDPGTRDTRQSDLFIQYSKVLQVLARQAPLVLTVDDLQWADLGSISLLFHLSRYLAGSRILIVGSYRPEEIALGRAGERHPLESVLNELQRMFGDNEINVDSVESHAFVDELLDSEPNRLGPQFRDILCRLTRGQPLFTVELLRGMQERGDLVKDEENRWIEGPALDWETLPARVEAVIAERVGRLDPLLQTTLRTASVEGEVFTAEVVARVQEHEEGEILSRLSNELDRKHRLVRAQSIQRVDGQLLSCYRFQHTLVQKYLYNSLDEVERVHVHGRVGQVLEDLYANQAGIANISPQLARHFREARIAEKAIHYLRQSGERALQVFAYQEAITHLEGGLALLATLPDPQKFAQQELSLQLALSVALNLASGTPDMEQASIRALELSQQIGNTTQLVQGLCGLSIMNYVKGEPHIAYKHAEEALKLGLQSENQLLIVLGRWCLGFTLFGLGDYLQAREHLEQVASFYQPQAHHRPLVLLRGVDAGVSSLAYLACCLWCLGYPEQALRRSQEALDLARKIGHTFSLADVLSYGGCELHAMRRDGQSLKAIAEELIRLLEEKNLTSWSETRKSCLGDALVLLGKPEQGVLLIREGVDLEYSLRVKCHLPRELLYLAEGYAKMGNIEQGMKAVTEALEKMRQTDEHHWEAELYRTLSRLQLLLGNDDEAEASLDKALDVARRQNARSWELRAAIDLAHLWQKQGRGDEGRQKVKEIYVWFTEGFDTPDLREARKLIGEVS
jgi:DNA-binding SARP family transcriptional activator/tetratricopeptide (TPR) repeat protein